MTWPKIITWNLIFFGMFIVGREPMWLWDIAIIPVNIFLAWDCHHGRYRKADSSSHGGAANGTGAPAGGGAKGAAGSSKGAGSPLPRSGVETGEIIGWRVWLYMEGDLLKSVTRRTNDGPYPIWPPGEPMTGEPGDYDRAGVHAWKTKREALEYNNGWGILGRVALWGSVVEHERGYRAEYGKIVSIDYINLWGIGTGTARTKNDESRAMDQATLIRLRKVYGVEEFTMTVLKDD
jgi:hypothetical protein